MDGQGKLMGLAAADETWIWALALIFTVARSNLLLSLFLSLSVSLSPQTRFIPNIFSGSCEIDPRDPPTSPSSSYSHLTWGCSAVWDECLDTNQYVGGFPFVLLRFL